MNWDKDYMRALEFMDAPECIYCKGPALKRTEDSKPICEICLKKKEEKQKVQLLPNAGYSREE